MQSFLHSTFINEFLTHLASISPPNEQDGYARSKGSWRLYPCRLRGVLVSYTADRGFCCQNLS